MQPTGGRDSHCRVLRGAEILHTRFGVTDPAVFRALRTSATGIDLPEVPTTRYTSLAYVQQASARTAVRHESFSVPAHFLVSLQAWISRALSCATSTTTCALLLCWT